MPFRAPNEHGFGRRGVFPKAEHFAAEMLAFANDGDMPFLGDDDAGLIVGVPAVKRRSLFRMRRVHRCRLTGPSPIRVAPPVAVSPRSPKVLPYTGSAILTATTDAKYAPVALSHPAILSSHSRTTTP